ncbi:P-loop containing nucleoside triphosphate hydrolase protein [Hyaloraphidium curvatum]|nr:P-loop containing nucleoside triphosphate hydrolase protein [Hyaloraphidium curvatum]
MLTVEEGVDMNDEPVRARPARKRKGVARLETPADDDEDVEMASPVEDDRRDEQEDDDEADDIEEERPRKRLRKSGAVRKLEPTPEESDPVTDGGESEDEEGGGPSQGAKPRAPRAKRDGGKKLSKPLSAGAAGTIGRIQLYNIMCHRNLEVDFIDKVNFVTGQNGSGKSSILVALTLALGGKTRATSRGDSVKDVLYYGQSWGEIVVYLRNEGEEAYKPDIFGKHIRVVRRMTTTSTQYKLQNAEGTTISTKRSDLQDLLDHYHIDVSNPLCVLTQEMAKQFLANSSDEDKYKFFLIGTNLANLKKDIGHIKDRIHSILGSLPDMKAHRDQLGKKKTELERRFQEIEANRGLEEQIQQLKNQLAWSEAAEAEDVGGSRPLKARN